MRDPALTSALEKVKPSALARLLGITPHAVIQWDRVPPARVVDVEKHTGISRHELRPDIFGPPASTPSPDAIQTTGAAA